ncbi:MAG: hypothetical protein ACTIJ9_07175 [Aequorivita sp.]
MTTLTNNLEINKLQTLLKYVFTIVPIVAGADKFFNILVQWDTYLAPSTLDMLPFSGATFMMIVGVIEIIAGILVFTKTQIGAYIVSIWLLLIALSLIFTWHHPDVAVRDIVMAISAFVLAKLSTPNVARS